MWPGAEPIRGNYNCSYFCVIHRIIQSLAKRGIYTMIDVHQDVLAKQFCYEGLPDVCMTSKCNKNIMHLVHFCFKKV